MQRLTVLLFAVILAGLPAANLPASQKAFRILHVMSYHSSWSWPRDQLRGFKTALAGLDVEYEVVELDTKRNSDDASIRSKAESAERIIAQWKPDLLYANDDNAQKYVSKFHVGSPLPIVFSAVNQDPSEYGFRGAQNVTGVLEHEHFVPTIKLLRQIAPHVRRIAVIVDSDPTWQGVVERMRRDLSQIDNLEITELALVTTLDEFKRVVHEAQGKVDAIAMLGVFNIKDENGSDVDYEEIQKWMTKHSTLPDFSFWRTRVERGTLCAVAVSGYEQGHLAGEMARKILLDGVTPGAIPIQPSTKGQPLISLARARDLGLKIDVEVLLNAEALKDYDWEH